MAEKNIKGAVVFNGANAEPKGFEAKVDVEAPEAVAYKDAQGQTLPQPLKFVKLSQAEYNALETKDANTLYIISAVA